MKPGLLWQRIFFGCLAIAVLLAYPLLKDAPTAVHLLILLPLVILLGLPHGALDPLIAYRAHIWRRPLHLAGFLTAYLSFAAIVIALWNWLPPLAFAGFLCISIWHFSGDWEDDLPLLLRRAVGTLIITGPALFHPELTARAFAALTSWQTAWTSVQILQFLAVPALIGSVCAVVLSRRCLPGTSFEIGLIMILLWLLPPLLFFAVYFCGLHSPRHLIENVQGLRPLPVLGTALGFTVLTVAGGLLFIYLLPAPEAWEPRLLQVLFIGLAALTLPHILLVEGWKGHSS